MKTKVFARLTMSVVIFSIVSDSIGQVHPSLRASSDRVCNEIYDENRGKTVFNTVLIPFPGRKGSRTAADDHKILRNSLSDLKGKKTKRSGILPGGGRKTKIQKSARDRNLPITVRGEC